MATLLAASLRRRAPAAVRLQQRPAAPQLCSHRRAAAAVAPARGLTTLSLRRLQRLCPGASACRGCGGHRPTLSTLQDLVREFATGPPLSRAERRRQERAQKKGRKPLPTASASVPTAAQKAEDEKYKAPTIELSGITDLVSTQAICHDL